MRPPLACIQLQPRIRSIGVSSSDVTAAVAGSERSIELGNEQYNEQFVEQVAAMEARAKSLGMVSANCDPVISGPVSPAVL